MIEAVPRFSWRRSLKLGSFHVGSAFADILVTGIWNRILISDFGVDATPVALLAALRYLIAPLTIWVGHRSDTTPLLGKRRLSYIYLGRFLTWLSLPLLPLATVRLGASDASAAGWGLALLAFLLYGLGTLVSGSPFLALVRESAPPARQGLAVVVVQTVLLAFFVVVAIIYSALMPTYTLGGFWRLVAVAMTIAALSWFWSVWREERPVASSAAAREAIDFGALIRRLWREPNTRTFFGLLSAGSIALFAQDVVLEPFGADLFGLDVGGTTRFNVYYGSGVLLAMIGGAVLTRRWRPQDYGGITSAGLMGVVLTMALLALTALGRIQPLVVPGIFLFGLASGVYTVGGLSLMIAMTDDAHAGAYLGLWSMVQLVFRGVALFLGGLVRDAGIVIARSAETGYAAVFVLEALAAVVALALLWRLTRLGYLYMPSRPTERGALTAAD